MLLFVLPNLTKEKNMSWWYGDLSRYNGVFDKILDEFPAKSSKVTTYDVQSDDKSLTLTVDLPGAKSADLKVEALHELVKISGKQKGKDFAYEYPLSKIYNPQSGIAKLEDGVLTLVFMKHERDKPKSYFIPVS